MQIIKYCQTCQSSQKSFFDDCNRCIKCGNVFDMGLTVAPAASSAVRTFINETVRSGSTQSECLIVQGNVRSGNGNCEIVRYDGQNFFYEKKNG